jgi:hypothetical protein
MAQEIPVNLKADKLKIIEGTSIVEASGSVEVKFKDATIYADHVIMDSDTNVATAEGHVRLLDRQYQAKAGSLVYDADNEQSSFTNFSTIMWPQKLRGPLVLTARTLDDPGSKMIGKASSLSTCDKPQAHYHALADKVEYYPDDKILGYNSTLYIGDLPCLWLPFLYYDLNGQRRRNWMFGHNDVEGDYLKSTWGYPLGILYLDLMQKKGLGLGTQNDYNLLGLGGGTLFLYNIKENDTGITDWITRINHSKQITPWTKLNLTQKYTATYLIPTGRKDQTEVGLGLQYRDKANLDVSLDTFDDRQAFYKRANINVALSSKEVSTNYSANYEFSTQAPNWERLTQRFSHRHPLWSGASLSMRADYYNNVAAKGEPGDERLEPIVELTGQEKSFSWRFVQNWYIDLDQNTYTGDNNYQYLEKLPEIEISPNVLDLAGFRLQTKGSYGYYHEVRYVPQLLTNRSFATQRYRLVADINRDFALPVGTTLGFGIGGDQLFYGPGDAMYNYRERLGLQTNLGGIFRNELNYQKGLSDGNSPFLFDQLGSRYHNVTDRITFYYLDRFRWTIDGGHNWQSHQWMDVMTSLMLKPASWLGWNASSGWSIEQRQYKDFINNLTLTPCDFFSWSASAISDLNNGQLKNGSLNYDLFILAGQPNQWHVTFNQVLDAPSQQFKVRDIMVAKELHCWRLIYTYNDYRKEFSFTLSLNALPDAPIGVSSGRGFSFDALEKSLNQINPEGAVQRY